VKFKGEEMVINQFNLINSPLKKLNKLIMLLYVSAVQTKLTSYLFSVMLSD